MCVCACTLRCHARTFDLAPAAPTVIEISSSSESDDVATPASRTATLAPIPAAAASAPPALAPPAAPPPVAPVAEVRVEQQIPNRLRLLVFYLCMRGCACACVCAHACNFSLTCSVLRPLAPRRQCRHSSRLVSAWRRRTCSRSEWRRRSTRRRTRSERGASSMAR